MKYMIMMTGSQRDYDLLAGKSADGSAWTPDESAAFHEFMVRWNNDLVESGEFVDARGLTAPVHARRIRLREGSPVVTDGPYAETQEVLAGYTVVECESFDRATEIAAKLADAPGRYDPNWYVDVRPVAEGVGDLDG
jgi:hypothetical protein